jgi:4-diphosphocytidyl-2-C-methyl-D-erythritol kinase
VRIEVEKRIPVAAGLGGGSADAAAVLRLARGALAEEELLRIAAGLGADVPSQLEPGFALVGGAGEVVTPLPEPEPFAAVLLPDPAGLSTPDVYAEADRLGLGRTRAELAELRGRLLGAAAAGASPLSYGELLVNDLAGAAISLRPSIGEALAALEGEGAELALVTGSGPTAVGLFADGAAAAEAGEALNAAGRRAIVTGSGILR